jgi:hypothetical protein
MLAMKARSSLMKKRPPALARGGNPINNDVDDDDKNTSSSNSNSNNNNNKKKNENKNKCKNINMIAHVLAAKKNSYIVLSDPERKGNNVQSYGGSVASRHRFSAKRCPVG